MSKTSLQQQDSDENDEQTPLPQVDKRLQSAVSINTMRNAFKTQLGKFSDITKA